MKIASYNSRFNIVIATSLREHAPESQMENSTHECTVYVLSDKGATTAKLK